MEGTFGNLVAHWSRRLQQESGVSSVEKYPFNLFVALSGLATFVSALQDLAEWSHEDTTLIESGSFGQLLFDFATTVIADSTLQLKEGDRKRVLLTSGPTQDIHDVLDYLTKHGSDMDVEAIDQIDGLLGIGDRMREMIVTDIVNEFCEKLDYERTVEDAVEDALGDTKYAIAEACNNAIECAMEKVDMERRP